MSKPIAVEDFTKDGDCSRCGACCSNYLPMSKKELKVLKRWVKRKHFKMQKSKDVLDITCPFFDKEAKMCACYEVRPEVCRNFLCKTAKEGGYSPKDSSKFPIVNVRKDIFHDNETIPFADFQLLMEYIRNGEPYSYELRGFYKFLEKEGDLE